MKSWMTRLVLASIAGLLSLGAGLAGCGRDDPGPGVASSAPALSDEQIEDLVRRSYPYVAMYNVNNKFAMKQGGWNTLVADTALKDHTMKEIARPNNDTLYISGLFDLRTEPMVLEMPAFDSDYVSLMITGYDHYVNIPMTTRVGDFRRPEAMLIYSAHTGNFDRQPVEGITGTFEATGDFVSAVLRVMPHASDPDRFARITGQMRAVKAVTLSEFLGREPIPVPPVSFPAVGRTDADVFGDNLLEVMQFVLNHTTFAPDDPLDQALLAAYEPLGIVPGGKPDAAHVAQLDGTRLRETAERVASAAMARAMDPQFSAGSLLKMFQPKGKMDLETLVIQSVLGPIGLPATEAVYPPVVTSDGTPMNALHDYVIRMKSDELPPTSTFWSTTLYDMKNGFFIPNDRKKYSVGENGGMKLDADGGIAIYIAAEKPEGVPEQNWLPVERRDEAIDVILRIYVPDLERLETWAPPRAERLD